MEQAEVVRELVFPEAGLINDESEWLDTLVSLLIKLSTAHRVR